MADPSSNEYLDLTRAPLYLCGGKKVFRAGEVHVTRHHPNDILLIILSGTLHFTENGVAVELHAGEYYIQHRGKHQRGTEPSDAVYYYFDFFGHKSNAHKQVLSGRGSYIEGDILPICERLLALERADAVPNTQKAAVFHELLCRLYRRQTAALATNHAAIVLCDYLDAHYTEQIPLEAVARRFNYSTDYLIRFFKSQYGVTPHRYITQRRMTRAKLLLSEGGMSMSEVALACGYTDYSAFWRAFTRANGITPGEWSRQQGYEKS